MKKDLIKAYVSKFEKEEVQQLCKKFDGISESELIKLAVFNPTKYASMLNSKN